MSVVPGLDDLVLIRRAIMQAFAGQWARRPDARTFEFTLSSISNRSLSGIGLHPGFHQRVEDRHDLGQAATQPGDFGHNKGVAGLETVQQGPQLPVTVCFPAADGFLDPFIARARRDSGLFCAGFPFSCVQAILDKTGSWISS